MPRDFDHLATEAGGLDSYPADRPGWCDAIAVDERAVQVSVRTGRRAGRALPESDDLLGWGVLLLAAPALLAGTLILGQAALHLL